MSSLKWAVSTDQEIKAAPEAFILALEIIMLLQTYFFISNPSFYDIVIRKAVGLIFICFFSVFILILQV